MDPNAEAAARRRARALWRWVGEERPPFALTPGPGQQSVWDYPRPPRIEADAREVVVRCGSVELARTRRALRVLETASPPSFYLPWEDVRRDCFRPAPGASICEWKGRASYWTIEIPDGGQPLCLEAAAWSYESPNPAVAALCGHVSVYPARLDCWLAGERVRPQPGRFYGGWITDELVGPFKGEPGSEGW